VVVSPAELGPENDCAGEDSSGCNRQTRPLVREGAPYRQARKSQTIIKIWSYAPDRGLIPRETGRLTVGRNITVLFSSVVCRKIT
jgi:hypothetical protein